MLARAPRRLCIRAVRHHHDLGVPRGEFSGILAEILDIQQSVAADDGVNPEGVRAHGVAEAGAAASTAAASSTTN